MSSASANSVYTGLTKRRLLAFWGILAIGGLIPALAEADTQPQAPQAPKPSQQISPAADEYLSQSDALSAIPDLNISIVSNNANKSAFLTGLVPHGCADMISVASTTTDASISAGKIAGFSIYAKKGFISCVQQQNTDNGSCKNAAVVNCDSLSKLGQAAAVNLPANETVSVAYLNKVNNDSALGDNWTAANFGSSALISYSAADLAAQKEMQEEHAKARHDAALQSAILKCAQSRDGINDARDSLASSGLDSSTIDDLTAKVDEFQKRFDSKDLSALQNKVGQAVQQGKIDQFDALEDQIYDYYGAHADSGNQLAQMVYDLAKARSESESATGADIDKAQATLNRALDSDSGLNLSDKNTATFQAALNFELPKMRLEASYRACDQDSYNLRYAQQSMYSGQMMNPQASMTAINNEYKNAQSACKSANKMYDDQTKALTKQLKDAHCSAVSSSAPASLFGNSRSDGDSSRSDSGHCQELNNQLSSLSSGIQDVSTQDAQEAQEAMKNAMPQQLPGGVGGQGGMMGVPSAQQMPQQMPLVSPNTMYGPRTPTFGGPMSGLPGTMGTGASYYGGAQPVMIPTNGSQMSTMPGTMGTPYYSGYYYGQSQQPLVI